MSEDKTFQVNDNVTISRGKNAGQTGTVQFVDTTNRKLALNISGELVTTTFSNVKVPDEPTVTKSELLLVLKEYARAQDDGAAENFVMRQLFPADYDSRAVN